MGLVISSGFRIGLILLIGCFFFVTSSAIAQGDYLEFGQNGGQVGFQFAASDNVSGFYLGGGLSHKGIIDGQFSVGIIHLTSNNASAKNLAFAPSINFYPIKQGRANIPFSMALGAGCRVANYWGESTSTSETSSSVGAWLLRNFNIVESFIVQPNFGVSHIQQGAGANNYFNIGISLFSKLSDTNRAFRFDFSFSIAEYNKSFGFQMGLIFESLKKKVDER